jgi:hypothetical protein
MLLPCDTNTGASRIYLEIKINIRQREEPDCGLFIIGAEQVRTFHKRRAREAQRDAQCKATAMAELSVSSPNYEDLSFVPRLAACAKS